MKMAHEGKPIFNIKPAFEEYLHPTETPQEQASAYASAQKEVKAPKPKAPFFPLPEYVQTSPTYSPRDRTRGIEGFVKKI